MHSTEVGPLLHIDLMVVPLLLPALVYGLRQPPDLVSAMPLEDDVLSVPCGAFG
jgi:hypothetical protein